MVKQVIFIEIQTLGFFFFRKKLTIFQQIKHICQQRLPYLPECVIIMSYIRIFFFLKGIMIVRGAKWVRLCSITARGAFFHVHPLVFFLFEH